jgi:RNA polymerase sigma factor (sigma-70 family)
MSAAIRVISPMLVPDEGSCAIPLDAEHAGRTGQSGSPMDHWAEIVDRIQQGDPAAVEELYLFFVRGIRFFLCRQLGSQELDDKVHDTFVIVLQAIKRGELRDPTRLMAFVRTVVRRQVAGYIDQAVQVRKEHVELETGNHVMDHRSSPEDRAIFDEQVAIMLELLDKIEGRDREILERFYLQEQPQEQICGDMGLSETQFRLLKSRAKTRFGEIGRRALVRRALSKLSVRKKLPR